MNGRKPSSMSARKASSRACDAGDPERNELYHWVQDIVTGRGSAEELAAFLRERAVWVDD